ncbi:uncharacterized protein N0V89_001407 [Didymosphaeria variabile]|uniref:Heterokaryon incompatibility domain-containing protein n=1 Tax=Didymosphaeria variabile TaxID=1932322 RepID=A0A9W8XYD2_9PLEO|nr:uncharacterized protein N0V89_001407 [Didymosphaeria variabile]KAJ4360840.1 hypothetical protein N0V89_001407 [Didymosphaeria variabile]
MAARIMVVLCGSEELTGTCFFWALSGLLEWCEDARLRGVVSSILYLIGNASALRLNKPDGLEPFRLGICPLSQLLDMFRFREATDRRDKVYALLGIMSSDPATSDIMPDYGIEWAELFQNLVKSMLGQKVKSAWISNDGRDYGRILGKGCIVGYVSDVDNSKNHHQTVSITPTYHRSPMVHQESKKAQLRWILHNSTAEVRHGDIVCWLDGSNEATIIRFQGNCFAIVVVLASFPPTLVKNLFQEVRDSTRHSSRVKKSDEMLGPMQHSRNLVLVWNFDPKWTTQWTKLSSSSEAEPKVMSTLSDMIRVLEDVNDTDALETLLERGSQCYQSGEIAPTGVMEHFQDLRQTLPNWDLYLGLKTDLQNVLCGEGFNSGLPNDIELDLVEIRARLTAYPEHGTELIRSLFNEVSFLSASTNSRNETFYDQNRRIKLAFMFDIWGHAITLDTMLALVEYVERINFDQRTTLGNFASPLCIEIVEVLVRSSAQHPEWGTRFVERFISFAKGDADRMYCLVRAFIVSCAAAAVWKQQVVEAVLATHFQEVSEAIVDKNAWSSLDIGGRYTTIVDFLWSHYVLRAKDFVGISISGTFQLRSQLMEKFVNDYRFWKACYDGRAADIWSGVVESGRVDPHMLVICKDVRGRWCRVAAFEAAAMNGHVACCKLLLERGFGYRITSALRMQLCDRESIPNAKEIAKLLSTYNLADWEIRTVAEGSSGAASRNGRRSETW